MQAADDLVFVGIHRTCLLFREVVAEVVYGTLFYLGIYHVEGDEVLGDAHPLFRDGAVGTHHVEIEVGNQGAVHPGPAYLVVQVCFRLAGQCPDNQNGDGQHQ